MRWSYPCTEIGMYSSSTDVEQMALLLRDVSTFEHLCSATCSPSPPSDKCDRISRAVSCAPVPCECECESGFCRRLFAANAVYLCMVHVCFAHVGDPNPLLFEFSCSNEFAVVVMYKLMMLMLDCLGSVQTICCPASQNHRQTVHRGRKGHISVQK